MTQTRMDSNIAGIDFGEEPPDCAAVLLCTILGRASGLFSHWYSPPLVWLLDYPRSCCKYLAWIPFIPSPFFEMKII
jgi:hypothetical protein